MGWGWVAGRLGVGVSTLLPPLYLATGPGPEGTNSLALALEMRLVGMQKCHPHQVPWCAAAAGWHPAQGPCARGLGLCACAWGDTQLGRLAPSSAAHQPHLHARWLCACLALCRGGGGGGGGVPQVPPAHHQYRAMPLGYLGHLLGHEGEGGPRLRGRGGGGRGEHGGGG